MQTSKKPRGRSTPRTRAKPQRRPGAAQKTGVRATKHRSGKAERAKTALAVPQKPLELTVTERAIVKEYYERQARCPAPPVCVVTEDGKQRLETDHHHHNKAVGSILLMNALGTASLNFADGLLRQLMVLSRRGEEISETALNFMLASIKGIAPRDETEAMLASQMVAVHSASMSAARQLADARVSAEQDAASNRLNKLARTYAAQMEALKKYRSAGEQTIKVQHVVVNQGGQAIVGNVAPGGSGVVTKSEDQPHALTVAPGAALRSKDEARELVPSAGDAERPLPDARRQVNGRAQG
jgi:hypothetical protein